MRRPITGMAGVIVLLVSLRLEATLAPPASDPFTQNPFVASSVLEFPSTGTGDGWPAIEDDRFAPFDQRRQAPCMRYPRTDCPLADAPFLHWTAPGWSPVPAGEFPVTLLGFDLGTRRHPDAAAAPRSRPRPQPLVLCLLGVGLFGLSLALERLLKPWLEEGETRPRVHAK